MAISVTYVSIYLRYVFTFHPPINMIGPLLLLKMECGKGRLCEQKDCKDLGKRADAQGHIPARERMLEFHCDKFLMWV